jgi:hypothetical protein
MGDSQVKSFNEYKEEITEKLSDIFDGIDIDSFYGDSMDKEFEKILESLENRDGLYVIHKDKSENFECSVSIEGTSVGTTAARVILDTEYWNLVFYGEIKADGTCVVPIKKGIPFPEGTRGEIRLEVLIDDQLFIGWRDKFILDTSKKVNVEIKDQKKVTVNFK